MLGRKKRLLEWVQANRCSAYGQLFGVAHLKLEFARIRMAVERWGYPTLRIRRWNQRKGGLARPAPNHPPKGYPPHSPKHQNRL